MSLPVVQSWVKKPDVLVGERVEVMCLGVLVAVAAAIGKGEVQRVGVPSCTNRKDVVKME